MTQSHDQTTRSHDAGDTLLEVLLAIIVLSLSVVALLTGLATSIAGSSVHRGLSTSDSVLRSFAESATYQIELAAAPLFSPCAPVSGTSYNGTPIVYTPPSHYVVSFVGAQYWSTSTNGLVSQAACTPASASGFQLLTAEATGPNGTETMSFGVRTK